MKIFISLLLLSISSQFVSANDSQDYKCFVGSSDGDKVVFYRWSIKEFNLKVAKLVGRRNTNKDGKKYYIKSVNECVGIEDDFSSEKGKSLDKVTLY